MRLRASILQQSAAAAKCYHENNNGSDNEHDDDDETGVSTGGGKVDWLRPFEQKDHAGTGAVEHEDLKEVLIEVRKSRARLNSAKLIVPFDFVFGLLLYGCRPHMPKIS